MDASDNEKRRLNICIVARSFPSSSRAEGLSFLRLIARRLAMRGHSVTVLTGEGPSGRGEKNIEGVRMFFLMSVGSRQRAQNNFATVVRNKFAELHAKDPFDIVHSVDSGAIKISLYKRIYRVAIAYDVAATRLSDIFSLMARSQENLGSILSTGIKVAIQFLRSFYGHDRQLLKSADGIFVASNRERLALERYYLYPDHRIHTIPYGIEIGDTSPRERSESLRKSLGISQSAKVVVTVTDMRETAEIANILRAFESIVQKKSNTRLLIIGSGPKFKQLEFMMLNMALGSRVLFTGHINSADLPDYIALADVFVNLSSRTTGFEPSLLEAMVQKKVIIGSEVSPMATIVEPSRDGFLIRPADVQELTDLLLGVFSGQIRCDEIGEAARLKVINLFDPEKMVIETLDAYYAILKDRRD